MPQKTINYLYVAFFKCIKIHLHLTIAIFNNCFQQSSFWQLTILCELLPVFSQWDSPRLPRKNFNSTIFTHPITFWTSQLYTKYNFYYVDFAYGKFGEVISSNNVLSSQFMATWTPKDQSYFHSQANNVVIICANTTKKVLLLKNYSPLITVI